MLMKLLFAMWITLQPAIILDNGSSKPSCWEGNCVVQVWEDGEVSTTCQAYCNPPAAKDGGWKKHAPKETK